MAKKDWAILILLMAVFFLVQAMRVGQLRTEINQALVALDQQCDQRASGAVVGSQ